MRYDNERGKGDNRHYGEREEVYSLVSGAQLVADFLEDVAKLTGETPRRVRRERRL